jgi:acetyl esterase
MPVHPQLQPLIEAFAPFTSLDWATIGVEGVREMAAQGAPPPVPIEIAGVEGLRVPSPEGGIDARLYRPSAEPRLPTIMFLHGGGWVMGTLDQYDSLCRFLARESKCAVFAVDYRLAPEHPYPAATEDCFAALEWLGANAHAHDLDAGRLAIAGDSAGGNLSTAIALAARERSGPSLRHQALLYPVIDRRCDTASHKELDRYLLTSSMMRWYWDNYVGDRSESDVPLAAPASFASLEGLPPATVLTAEFDPLRDEGEAYACALARSGVPTELVRVPGMIHGFAYMIGLVDAAETWLRHVARRLSHALRD